MKVLIMVLGILLFAFATAVLVVWGMRRAYFQRERLTGMLLSKSADRVMNHLKTNETITEPQMRKLVEGVQATEFLSRQRATAQADQAFTMRLIEAMLHDGLIEPAQEGKKIYRKKVKKD